MNLKLILAFALAIPCVSLSQNSDRKKPSWSEDLPERQEQPDLELQNEEFESDFGLSRDDLFSDSSRSEDSDSASNEEIDKAKQEAEAERQAKEKAEQLAAEQAEIARIATEKAAQEEAQRIAREEEIERLRKENEELKKAQAEQASSNDNSEAATNNDNVATAEVEDPPTQDQSTEEPSQTEPEPVQTSVQSVDSSNYPWKILKNDPAKYPPKAIRDGTEGWVDVELTINPEGVVTNTISKGVYRNYRVFIKPALNAVKKWKYEPPRNYGINEPLTKVVRVVFEFSD